MVREESEQAGQVHERQVLDDERDGGGGNGFVDAF